jgi:predicted nuclease of predicted toxin-antitoxin system
MRLLANENIPEEAVAALRQAGYDVAWVRSDAPGSSDPQVLARAIDEGRILVTFDKDFGELAYRAHLPSHCGIILLRIRASSPAWVARAMVASLAARQDWAGHFSVVEEQRIRMRPLP